MKGWLYLREGPLVMRAERYFFKLQWGVLSSHLTEASAAISKHFVHEATILASKRSLKITIEVGLLGSAYAHATPGSSLSRLILLAEDESSFKSWMTCLFRARCRPIEEWYTRGPVLGEGSNGSVFLGTSRWEQGKRVAVKRMPFLNVLDESTVGQQLCKITREIQMQHRAASRSEYVAKVLDVFYSATTCYVVLEYGNKGSVSQLLDTHQGAFPEELVRSIAIQLGRCLLALHQRNIVHRDVKCDNVILKQEDSSPLHLMLIDFGFATAWRPDCEHSVLNFCSSRVGTNSYMAPEIWHGERYGTPADVFSMGVLCYVCITGEFPFNSEFPESVPSFTAGNVVLENLGFAKKISFHAISFCRQLLQADPKKRPTAAALLQHRWLRAGQLVTSTPRRRPSASVSSKVVLRRAFIVVSVVLTLKKLARRGSPTAVAVSLERPLQTGRVRQGRQVETEHSHRRMQMDLDIFEAQERSRVAIGAAIDGGSQNFSDSVISELRLSTFVAPALTCLRPR